MDAVLLARLQFALTIGFHFIFPSITIGLAWMLVALEGLAWRRRDPYYQQIATFFGRLFAITFAVGVATGIVMEFQFGTNWAHYSRFVGDIFGAPLAAEGVFAFFLESTFLGLYLFGRKRVSRGLHWFSILMVAFGATLSGFWILVANSWQQTPAGYVLRNGRAELTSFYEAVFNPSTVIRFLHTIDATLITGAFFVAGSSAWLLLKGRATEGARKALRLSLIAAAVFSMLELFPLGDHHAKQVARYQPAKLAAMEGLYGKGQTEAPLLVFGVPTLDPPEIKMAVGLPGMLSWLAFGDRGAYVKGLGDLPPDEVPQGMELVLTFGAFHAMVGLGTLFIGLSCLGVLLIMLRRLERSRWFLWALTLSVPLPVLACQLGWITTEVGRQPWIVHGLLKTKDAASVTVTAGEILFSILLFGVIYALLGALWLWLMARRIKLGPAPLPVPAPPATPQPAEVQP